MCVEKLSEEHGFIARGDADIAIGERLRLLPNHACAVANLAEHLVVVDRDGESERWEVAARGKVR